MQNPKWLNSAILDFEANLARLFNRKYCFLTGRGASALYVAIKALNLDGKKAVLPAISCPSPANVAVCAGLKPIFCDIELDTFGMCPDHLQRILAETDDVGVVIPVHLYGLPAQIKSLTSICKRANIPVIEDAAQAMGATYGGQLLGSWGDLSILSFGSTKIVDVGFGGAVLTDNDDSATLLSRLVHSLPSCPNDIKSLYSDWRACYYSLSDLRKRSKRFDKLFESLPAIFSEMYAFKIDDQFNFSAALAQLNNLPNLLAARKEKASTYAALLNKKILLHADYSTQSAPWRYSCLVPQDIRDGLTQELRKNKINASNWYPKLVNWYPISEENKTHRYPIATRVENEILNLWLDGDTSIDEIRYTCDLINQFLTNSHYGG